MRPVGPRLRGLRTATTQLRSAQARTYVITTSARHHHVFGRFDPR